MGVGVDRARQRVYTGRMTSTDKPMEYPTIEQVRKDNPHMSDPIVMIRQWDRSELGQWSQNHGYTAGCEFAGRDGKGWQADYMMKDGRWELTAN